MKTILLAGATGYLGKYIAIELQKYKYLTNTIVRNRQQFESYNIQVNEIIQAELTKKQALKGCCKNIDTVISTVGITKQKDGLSYMDVDYQANSNLLDEAKKSGVRKFIYVSVLNGEKLQNLKICAAKEKFVTELKKSGLEYCILRPNGFFSDLTEFYKMAEKGRIYLFGDGTLKSNPIHGEDLAKVCVEAIEDDRDEIEVGGPDILTQNEISKMAFNSLSKKIKITHIPDWIRKMVLRLGKIFLNDKTFGPIEFFMNVMAIELVAPKYGKRTLKEYYNKLAK